MSTERPTPPLPRADLVVDATGLLCPGPIVELAKGMRTVEVSQIVEVIGTDPGLLADAPAWAHQTGHAIIGAYSVDGQHHSGSARSTRSGTSEREMGSRVHGPVVPGVE